MSVAHAHSEPMARAVSREVIGGLQWTLWLSLLTLPFSYANVFFLARIGPEALGTFGIVQLYIGVVSVFLYLGGNSVLMYYLPHSAPERRLQFAGSYLAVIIAWMLPMMIAVVFFPKLLTLAFGPGDAATQYILLSLAPVYIVFCVAVAALKGMFD